MRTRRGRDRYTRSWVLAGLLPRRSGTGRRPRECGPTPEHVCPRHRLNLRGARRTVSEVGCHPRVRQSLLLEQTMHTSSFARMSLAHAGSHVLTEARWDAKLVSGGRPRGPGVNLGAPMPQSNPPAQPSAHTCPELFHSKAQCPHAMGVHLKRKALKLCWIKLLGLTSTRARKHAHTYAHTHARTHARMYTHIRTHAHTHANAHILGTHIRTPDTTVCRAGFRCQNGKWPHGQIPLVFCNCNYGISGTNPYFKNRYKYQRFWFHKYQRFQAWTQDSFERPRDQ